MKNSSSTIITLEGLSSSSGHSSGGIVGVEKFTIQSGQSWGVIGGNGSGKSTFANILVGAVDLSDQQRQTDFQKILKVSFEDERGLLEREIYEDDSEYLDKVDQGRSTYELITEHLEEGVDIEFIIEAMQLGAFLQTGFRLLSTGERRRMMIARALSQAPEMLVLDEPYDGLDRDFVAHLKTVIAEVSQKIPVVLIVNRMSHLGEHITHLACLHQMELVLTGTRQEIEVSPLWRQLQSMHTEIPPLPDAPPETIPYTAPAGQPVIEMRSVSVGYHEKPIIHDLDWTIMPGEHWQLSGPNGCGKSTLVNLISGDHPQCYSNEIHLFGSQRGKGESIWDIKRHMGLMSTALHQQYRVSVIVETVLLSGFFDSIGVYRSVSPVQKGIVSAWLRFLQMESYLKKPFQQLSFGQQRMLLIARALIKHPHLLILDEPCQGLDPMNRALVIKLIEQIAERDIAQILYISHDAEDRLACLTHELKFIPSDRADAGHPPYQIKMAEME
ncbi:MAG: molybdate ABC transporter ATP-binding protein ModF [Akkermansiaceae bacterium]